MVKKGSIHLRVEQPTQTEKRGSIEVQPGTMSPVQEKKVGFYQNPIEKVPEKKPQNAPTAETKTTSSLFGGSGFANIGVSVPEASEKPKDQDQKPVKPASSLFGNLTTKEPTINTSTGTGLFGNSLTQPNHSAEQMDE